MKQTSKRSKSFEGKINLTQDSGLRKLMRATKRGKLDPERKRLIDRAEANAAKRLSR